MNNTCRIVMYKSIHKKVRENFFAYLFLAPSLIILTLVIVVPLVEAISYSFTNTSLINLSESKIIGLDNYKQLLHNTSYWAVFKNTIVIVFSTVGISVVVGVFLALVLRDSTKFNNILRSIFIIPWLIPGVAVGIIWKWVLSTESGILNYIFRQAGILKTNFPFLADPAVTPWIVVVVFTWISVPYILVTTVAALQVIPKELEEAGIIDGASYIQRLFRIIFPIILPVLSITVVLQVISVMQDFAVIYSLTQGGPGNSTETFVISVYTTAFNSSQIGMACAIGVTWLLFLLIFIVLYIFLMAKKD